MSPDVHRRSPLALAVLAVLCYAPLHPYRMQQLLKAWGKQDVVNLGQRATLYKVIERLAREGLVRVREVLRDGLRPERVVYEITDDGRAVVGDWIRSMVGAPSREYPEFPAGLSFAMLLGPEDALRHLERRRKDLEVELGRLAHGLAAAAGVPRVALLDTEYQQAVTEAQLRWVGSVVEDLRAGRLTWSEEQLRAAAQAADPTRDAPEAGPEPGGRR